jgi:hypothetical protein
MKRTGSIGSWVGPAVTRARLPASGRAAGARRAMMASKIAAGSAMRPGPYSPQAISPSSGPTMADAVGDQALDIALHGGVLPHPHVHGRGHQHRLVGGQQHGGGQVARPWPWAALAIRSAVAGATTTRSAERDRAMWSISASSVCENRSWRTFTNSRPGRRATSGRDELRPAGGSFGWGTPMPGSFFSRRVRPAPAPCRPAMPPPTIRRRPEAGQWRPADLRPQGQCLRGGLARRRAPHDVQARRGRVLLGRTEDPRGSTGLGVERAGEGSGRERVKGANSSWSPHACLPRPWTHGWSGW